MKSNTKISVQKIFIEGYDFHRQGLLELARTSYEKVLQIQPENFDALHLSGVLAHQLKNHQLAVELINKSLKINDKIAEAHNNLGNALQSLKNYDQALNCFNKALQIKENYPEAHNNKGNLLQELKKYKDAIFNYNKAIELKQDYFDAYYNRGVCFRELKLYSEALSSYNQAITLKPNFAEAYSNRGNALHELNRFEEALESFEQAIEINPNFAIAYVNLGHTYIVLEHKNKAVKICQKAVQLAPEMAEAHCNLATAIMAYPEMANDTKYLALAKHHISKAQELNPLLSQHYVAMGRYETKYKHNRKAGQKAYELALEKEPDSEQALLGLIGIASDLGDRVRTRELSEQVIAISPNKLQVIGNHLYTLNYDPEADAKEIFIIAKKYGSLLSESLGKPFTEWPWNKKEKNKLKVGFVSGDFKIHPVSYFVVDLLKNLDRGKFEIYAYSSNQASDEMTSRLRENVDHWRTIAELNTKEACQLIRTDEIDVLFDLSGHTASNRLDIFAKKPAPVSASWLGFVTTTGLDTVDYFLTTRTLADENDVNFYTEKLMYMPHWAAIDIIQPPIPASLTSPYLKNGYITFASFNNFIKINDLVIDSWSKILKRIPNSKLWLNYRHVLDEEIQNRLIEKFSFRGIPKDRLILEYTTPRTLTIQSYANVDIALDTFPYGGGTTTYEAIYSGVPVITIKGKRFSSRLTANILESITGGDELITLSVEEYISKAVLLSSDINKLTQLRSQMRSGFDEVLGNTRSFADEFGKAIIQMSEMRGF
jgi:protein O-GlcNAc transferase